MADTNSLLRFLRFCCVGAAGFLVDTGTLLALVYLAAVPPILAKVLSFLLAVLVTFQLNRAWAFRDKSEGRWRDRFLSYISVQGVGLLCNWTVFTAWISLVPKPFGSVPVAAFVASGAALTVNYLGADRLVFRVALAKAKRR